ncbi:MAG: SRPBCC domain-containing protein [Litorilinea sp.]
MITQSRNGERSIMSANTGTTQAGSPAQGTVVETDGRELTLTRVFAAPRSLVFEAFSDCKHLKYWWGPTGWTLPVCEMDFRVGGVWHYCMGGPEGEESWGKAIYSEIVKPTRIVYMDYFSDAEGSLSDNMPGIQVTVTFEEDGNATKVVSRAQTGTDAEMQGLVEMGMVEGIKQTWDRLAEHLATQV